MSCNTVIYYIQAGFNNLVRFIEAGGVGLACWKAYYYFKDRDSEISFHQIQNSEKSINLFKSRIATQFKIICQKQNDKDVLNKHSKILIQSIPHKPKLPKNYTFDNLPSSQQKDVKENVRQNLVNGILSLLEEWAIGVKENPNNYKLIYDETHEDLISFINKFKKEFDYATINVDKYKAITSIYHKYLRSESKWKKLNSHQNRQKNLRKLPKKTQKRI